MDVPSPADGTVRELKVKVGDKVSQGTLILTLDAQGAAAAAVKEQTAATAGPPESREPPVKPASAPASAPEKLPDFDGVFAIEFTSAEAAADYAESPRHEAWAKKWEELRENSVSFQATNP